MGGAFGLTIIMIFFWMPETTFVRTGDAMLDTGSNNASIDLAFVVSALIVYRS